MSSSTLENLRSEKRREILALAEKYGVQNIRVFGSVARGDDDIDSDIDFLISLKQGRTLMDWSGFWLDMEVLLDRKVDVIQDKSLHWALRENVMADAIPL